MLMNYTRRKKGKINLIIDNPQKNMKPDGGVHIKKGVYIQNFIDEHLL